MPLAVQTDPFAHLAHAKQRAFLRALAVLGRHTRACHAVGIAHSHPSYWRRTDPNFAALERQAWDRWVQTVVETSVHDRDRATLRI
jgi:hypothetical protein